MRILLFTGKGGVGKTTTAAATALHAARCGIKTLVLSIDPARSLADALAVRLGPIPGEITASLFAQQADPAAADRPELQRHLTAALNELDLDPISAEELAELPGAAEVFSLLAVREAVRHGPWDLIVVDCPPSTETLRLLAAPELLSRCLARLLPMERRISRLLGPSRRSGQRPGGGLAADPVVQAVEALGAELAGVQTMLHSPATSIRLVLTAESVVLAETRRTWTALALHGFAVDAVVANRVFDSGPANDWRQPLARSQARVLAEAQTSFSPIPVQRSGYAPTEPVGLAALGELAEALYGPVAPEAAAALLAPPAVPEVFAVHPEADGFVLRLELPLVVRQDLELGRRGDELVVTVEGRRRVLPLPSALRRCQVTGATLRDGALSISFLPDPSQWRSR